VTAGRSAATGAGPNQPIAWRAVIPAFATTTIGMMPAFLTAGLAVQIRSEIPLSLTVLGLLIGSFFGIAGITSTWLGTITERLDWATALRVATLLSMVSLGGIGLAASVPWQLAVFLGIGGVAGAFGQVASNLAVARCVSPRRQGFVFGLRHAAVPAAAFLAGMAVPAVALTVGWRWAFVGAAAAGAAAAAAVPRHSARLTVNPPQPHGPGKRHDVTTPLRLLILLAVAVGLGTAGVDTIAGFFVTYAVAAGAAPGAAGFLLAAGSLLGMTSRVLSGWAVDRIRRSAFGMVATMIALGAIGVLLLNLAGIPGIVLGGLLGFAAGWGWAGVFTYAVVRRNPDAPATASGITQTGKYLGTAVGAPLFGTIADRISFTVAWWGTTLALLTAATLIYYVRKQPT
jgi:predicted MFS family arabinose efflux permease